MATEFTAVQDRLVLTVAELKVQLKIDDITDPENDANLQRMIDAIKERADIYLQNDFLDEDGVTELPIPPSVWAWCMQQLTRLYMRPADGVQEAEVRDLGKLIWEKDLDYSLISGSRNEWF